MFKDLDHVAIIVPDTEVALKTWRDDFGMPELFSEIVADGAIRLTHLGLGNTQLQLVEPLSDDHPLADWLKKNGPGLHHICLSVDNVETAQRKACDAGLVSGKAELHQGTQGKRALFIDKITPDGVKVEFTGQ